MTVQRPTYAKMRFAIRFWRDHRADPKHVGRAEATLVKLAREIDLDNEKHIPRKKR